MARAPSTAVAKWGNATAVRIPQSVMQKANLREGDAVHFEVRSPGIIVLRGARRNRTLQQLVGGITPQNRHGETDWGKPRGHEVW